MNKELQKFYFKSDISGVLGYLGGLFIIVFLGNLFNGFVLTFGDYLDMAVVNYKVIVGGYSCAIYIHTLNKTASDQWENFSLTKRERFNFLALRYGLAILVPQLILWIMSVLVNDSSNPYYYFLIIDVILTSLLSFVLPMFFVFISGNMVTGVFGVILGYILSSALVVVGNWSAFGRVALWLGVGALIIAMFFINRLIFEKREVEKLGKMFMFRWAEVLFTVCVTGTIVFVLNAIALPYSLRLINYVLVMILAVWVYMVIDTCFITNFRKDKIKDKVKPITILIPIGITTAIDLFFVLRIYELFN